MQRTSLNTTPICRIVGDININNSDSITIIDTNTNTETIDPTNGSTTYDINLGNAWDCGEFEYIEPAMPANEDE